MVIQLERLKYNWKLKIMARIPFSWIYWRVQIRHPLSPLSFDDFPMNDTGELILEPRYYDLQVRIAVYLYNKIGAEGQITHSENGISRSWESGDIPESLLNQVTPLVSTPFKIGGSICDY